MTATDQATQLRKGNVEIAVLKLIEAKPLYGYEIITKLEEAGLHVVQGTLYPLLTRLRKDELVSYAWEESSQGPPRKYYTLTSEGKKYLKIMTEEWKKINAGMNRLINT